MRKVELFAIFCASFENIGWPDAFCAPLHLYQCNVLSLVMSSALCHAIVDFDTAACRELEFLVLLVNIQDMDSLGIPTREDSALPG